MRDVGILTEVFRPSEEIIFQAIEGNGEIISAHPINYRSVYLTIDAVSEIKPGESTVHVVLEGVTPNMWRLDGKYTVIKTPRGQLHIIRATGYRVVGVHC